MQINDEQGLYDDSYLQNEDDFMSNDDMDDNQIPDDENNFTSNTVKYFLEQIKNKSIVNSSQKGDKLSPFYIPEFAKQLLRISKEFPLWSNVMMANFKSPYETETSASVEGNFAELKKNILSQKSYLLSVDRFISTHLINTDQMMKIARSIQVDVKSTGKLFKHYLHISY